jgi:hypothetical protein
MTSAMANRIKRLENASGIGGDDKTGFLAIVGPTEEQIAAQIQSVSSRYPNRTLLPIVDERLATVEIITDPMRAFERMLVWLDEQRQEAKGSSNGDCVAESAEAP